MTNTKGQQLAVNTNLNNQDVEASAYAKCRIASSVYRETDQWCGGPSRRSSDSAAQPDTTQSRNDDDMSLSKKAIQDEGSGTPQGLFIAAAGSNNGKAGLDNRLPACRAGLGDICKPGTLQS